MAEPYLCPSCKTNKSRFNIIEQVAKPVKKDPQTGEIMEEYSEETLPAIHVRYKDNSPRIQCGACGVIEEEITFIKRAQLNKTS